MIYLELKYLNFNVSIITITNYRKIQNKNKITTCIVGIRKYFPLYLN